MVEFELARNAHWGPVPGGECRSGAEGLRQIMGHASWLSTARCRMAAQSACSMPLRTRGLRALMAGECTMKVCTYHTGQCNASASCGLGMIGSGECRLPFVSDLYCLQSRE